MKENKENKHEIKEIDMTKISFHEACEMFRRGEHLNRNSDAYFLSLILRAAFAAGWDATSKKIDS